MFLLPYVPHSGSVMSQVLEPTMNVAYNCHQWCAHRTGTTQWNSKIFINTLHMKVQENIFEILISQSYEMNITGLCDKVLVFLFIRDIYFLQINTDRIVA
jgi:hypothetical protein